MQSHFVSVFVATLELASTTRAWRSHVVRRGASLLFFFFSFFFLLLSLQWADRSCKAFLHAASAQLVLVKDDVEIGEQ